jgi:hypothetical protein
MMAKHTHRGTCQACGAIQAVDNKTGAIAKHGYTVDWGMFEGECQGSHKLPLEKSSELTVQIIKGIEARLSSMELTDLDSLDWCGEEYRVASKNNLQYQAMTYHVAALRRLIETRQDQALYPAPKEEAVERIQERFDRIQDAYKRAEELKNDGWRTRVTNNRRDRDRPRLTATRKAA